MKSLSVHEAKAHFSSLLKEIEIEGSIIITKHDKPVAEIRAISERPRTRILGAFAEEGSAHLEVSWTDEELSEMFEGSEFFA
jgi:prevent-host-death family protein